MPEIKDYPDFGVGEEVGISIEYFGSDEVYAAIRSVEKPPTWNELWCGFRWRLRVDVEALWGWVRSKWLSGH